MSLLSWLEAVEGDADLRRGWHGGVDLVEEAARLNRAVPLVAAANHRSDVETRIWRPNLPVIRLASAVQRLLAPGGLKSGSHGKAAPAHPPPGAFSWRRRRYAQLNQMR